MLRKDISVTYDELIATFRKGLRNGNWRKLRFLDKALFRPAMGYAKYGGSIVNGKLVEKLLGLIEKLKETKGMRIFKFKRGFEKAVEMLENCMGAFIKVLAERPRLCLLAGDGEVEEMLGNGINCEFYI